MMKILVFDNYDSFTYNLVHLVEKILHYKVEVHRNDQLPLEKVKDYDKIILSPGPGIPEELQSRIFDRFYRVDKARSRENGGTGLGLAISKWAVEVNGGHLTLEPTGAGSCFRITLPQTATEEVVLS